MGTGVSHNLAQAERDVVLVDVSEDVLHRAREQIRRSVRMQALLGGGHSADADAILARIRFTTGLEELKDAVYVIENATESWAVKEPIYRDLDGICPEATIFAANTSAIPITRIASATRRPDRVVGIHFMNPVPRKKTVELIRGHWTSPETLDATRELLAAMGKEWVDVSDAPGFVSNRVLMLTVNEAAFLVQDGVAAAEDVDRVFRECFGHPMGPLETADLIGLDTILQSVEVLHDEFADSKYRPAPLLKRMVSAGLLGRKSGQGFYEYARR